MSEISVNHNPDDQALSNLGVSNWPTWSKEESKFPWSYDDKETCYLLEGEVVVTPDGGQPVEIKKGDLVTFPQGMSCTWDIKKAVKKHYTFG
jgi:uncharacterized cupin superfamily protein